MVSDVRPGQVARWRVRPRVLIVLASLALGLLAAIAAVIVAVTWPSLAVVNATQHRTATPRVFTQTYWVKNTGGTDVTVKSVDTAEATVSTVATNVHDSITIGEGRTVRIVMTFRVTDCAHAPEVVPVDLRVDRWWGTQTITVQDYGHGFDGVYLACLPFTR